MNRKERTTFTAEQKLDYAKLMINEGYTNKQIRDISGAGETAVSRWKRQYLEEMNGQTPQDKKALTPEQQKIQDLEKQLWRAKRDNEILKKAADIDARENSSLS
ncbi:MAG: transposase [Methyloprofundus sp.]|nr:transposase [Methyloprofundus sp.]MBW6453096.1 transposase [Methyloprofundus sp.]